MAAHSSLRIPIAQHAQGTYLYDFELPKNFFDTFENSLIPKGSGSIHVKLIKSSKLIQLDLHINCKVVLCCDRTLRSYTEKIELDKKLMIKFAEKSELCDDHVLLLTHTATHIELDQHIYDYICLALPMKRLHPSELDREELLYYSTHPDFKHSLGTQHKELQKTIKNYGTSKA